MRAGQLRHRITIEEPSETTNAFGEPVESWATFAEAYAAKEALRGSERFEAKQLNAEIEHRWTLRYLAGITAEMRIVHNGDVYEIVSPPLDPDGRRTELEILTNG